MVLESRQILQIVRNIREYEAHFRVEYDTLKIKLTIADNIVLYSEYTYSTIPNTLQFFAKDIVELYKIMESINDNQIWINGSQQIAIIFTVSGMKKYAYLQLHRAMPDEMYLRLANKKLTSEILDLRYKLELANRQKMKLADSNKNGMTTDYRDKQIQQKFQKNQRQIESQREMLKKLLRAIEKQKEERLRLQKMFKEQKNSKKEPKRMYQEKNKEQRDLQKFLEAKTKQTICLSQEITKFEKILVQQIKMREILNEQLKSQRQKVTKFQIQLDNERKLKTQYLYQLEKSIKNQQKLNHEMQELKMNTLMLTKKKRKIEIPVQQNNQRTIERQIKQQKELKFRNIQLNQLKGLKQSSEIQYNTQEGKQEGNQEGSINLLPSTIHKVQRQYKQKIQNKNGLSQQYFYHLEKGPNIENNQQNKNRQQKKEESFQEIKWEWDSTTPYSKYYQIEGNTVTRTGDCGQNYQITCLQPFPLSGRSKIKLKLVKYGDEKSLIRIGLITINRKKQKWSGSRAHLQSIAYKTDKQGEYGEINCDEGLLVECDKSLYLQQGGQLQLQVNMDIFSIRWVKNFNGNLVKVVQTQLPLYFKEKEFYAFICTNKVGDCVCLQ